MASSFKKFSLETQRLILLPISLKYKETIFKDFTKEIARYLIPQPSGNIKDTEEFIKSSVEGLKNGTNLQLVAIDKNTKEFLGCVGFHETNTKTPEFGLWLKKSAHGKGLGKEAITYLKEWVDKNIDYEFIKYPVAFENLASRKIPESLGAILFSDTKKPYPSGASNREIMYHIKKKK